ncbi:hypothetical protein DFP73DRAFT_558696 [Morchella snyderi]|nr:hypothetical protein DFP73DRAFT_558696 [Morchella snyderi]
MVVSLSSFPFPLTLMSPPSLSSSYAWQDRLIVFIKWILSIVLPTVEAGGVRSATDSAIVLFDPNSVSWYFLFQFQFQFQMQTIIPGPCCIHRAAGFVHCGSDLLRTSSTMSIPLIG